MHWRLWGDDDTDEIGIDNVIGGNRSGWFYEILNGSWKWKTKQFSNWMGKSSNGNKKEEVNRIRIHAYLFKIIG
jgi:hypothetical protein